MNEKHYTEQKHFKIFALLLSAEDEFFFIGKTSSPRLSAVYSNHICGRVAATAGYFDIDDEHPCLHLLEELTLTTAEAYKHTLAWINIFCSNGYTSLNHYKSVKQANSPQPDTATIIKELTREPLESILQRTFITRPIDADSPSSPKAISNPSEIIQMNVRMETADKSRFSAFCDRLHLNQREGFSLLLDHAERTETSAHLDSILAEKDHRILELEQQNRTLHAKLSKLTINPKEQLKEYISFLGKGIELYLCALFPQNEQASPMKVMPYRRFMKQKDPAITYQYPACEGFMLITLEALLWGFSRRRALFIVGISEDGTHFRFRHYPKKDFIGYPLKNSPYAFEGARWYVGYKKAADGAMDLVAALPLSPIIRQSQSFDCPLPEGLSPHKKPSLEAQIQDAQLRR